MESEGRLFDANSVFRGEPQDPSWNWERPYRHTPLEGVESCQGAPCLHFVRTVKGGKMDPRVPDTPESRYLGNGFTEDTWFSKGKGLIALEQKVNGKTSMTWILKRFSPAQ